MKVNLENKMFLKHMKKIFYLVDKRSKLLHPAGVNVAQFMTRDIVKYIFNAKYVKHGSSLFSVFCLLTLKFTTACLKSRKIMT
jgi:hypothetical protein